MTSLVAVVALVAFAVALFGCGWLLGRRALVPARRQLVQLRDQLDERTLGEERERRRADALVVDVEREQLSLTEAQSALVTALAAKRRAEQRVEELNGELSLLPRLREQVVGAAVLSDELDRVRAERDALMVLRDELALSEQYVETLQRELTYRDEQVLRLEDRLDELGEGLRPPVIDLTGDDLSGAASSR